MFFHDFEVVDIRNFNVLMFSSEQNDYIKSVKGFFLSATRLDNGNDGAAINDKTVPCSIFILVA